MDTTQSKLEDTRTQLLEVNLDPDVYFGRWSVTPIEWLVPDASVVLSLRWK